jgi:hypothetical protein
MIVNKEGCTEMHFSPEKNDEKEVGPKMGFTIIVDHSLKVNKWYLEAHKSTPHDHHTDN